MSRPLPPSEPVPPPPPRAARAAKAVRSGTSRRRPPRNLWIEIAKIVGGGAVGIVIALAILKYVLKLERFGGSRDERASVPWEDPRPEVGDQSRESAPSPPEMSSLGRAPRRRLPPPSAEVQAQLQAEIDTLLDRQLTDELPSEKQQQLAHRVRDLADDARDQPDERFMLLHKAADLAVGAGDLNLMTSLVHTLSVEYEFDAAGAREEWLRQFAESANTPQAVDILVPHAKAAIDEAMAEDRYDAALALAEATAEACRRPAGEKYREFVENGRARLARTHQRWPEYQNARRILETSPDDPAANLAVGHWLCLEKGAWSRGLAHLAKAGASPLADAARRDRAAASLPVGSALCLETAERWYAVAAADEENRGFLARALFWYGEAQGGLSGEETTLVEQRRDEIFQDAEARRLIDLGQQR